MPTIDYFTPTITPSPSPTGSRRLTFTIPPAVINLGLPIVEEVWAALKPQVAAFIWQEYDSHEPGGIIGDIVDPKIVAFLTAVLGPNPPAAATE